MFKRLIICAAIIAGFTTIVSAQIENELRSFTDSTEIFVNRGRQLLVNSMEQGNFDKAEEVFIYLNNLTKDKAYDAFYFPEKLAITLLVKDFKAWDSIAVNYKYPYTRIAYPNTFPIMDYLIEKVSDVSNQIHDDSDEHIDIEGRKILKLYLYYIKNGRDDTYNLMYKDFRKAYPNTKYWDFLRHALVRPKVKANFGYGAGISHFTATKNLSNYFEPNMGGHFALDFRVSNVIGSIKFSGSGFDLKESFSVWNNSDTLHLLEGDRFSYLQYALQMGYILVDGKKGRISPMVSIGGSNLVSNKFPPEEQNMEFYVFNSFTYGIGLQAEVKLVEFEMKNLYGYNTSGNSFIALRASYQYLNMAKFTFDEFKGSVNTVDFGIIWGFGDF